MINTGRPESTGNPLGIDFISEPCYNLIYLEIAACRLTALPGNIAALVPNLRVLNLNYNFLDDLKPLEGLRRLNKLTVIGSRLKGTKGIIKVLRGCPDLEMVDFRYVWLLLGDLILRRMSASCKQITARYGMVSTVMYGSAQHCLALGPSPGPHDVTS